MILTTRPKNRSFFVAELHDEQSKLVYRTRGYRDIASAKSEAEIWAGRRCYKTA